MTYWTILVITVLSGPHDGTVTWLLYRSEAECFAAHQTVSATLGSAYDHKVECIPSDTLSSSIRPKQRPEVTG